MSPTSLVVVFGLLAVQCLARDATLRQNCEISTDGGCKCTIKEGPQDKVYEYSDINECKKPVEVQTAEHKKALNAEIDAKFGDFKDNCFAKPSGGCKCTVDLGQGEEVKEFSDAADCKKSVEQITADNKKDLNAEIKEKFGDFKENCFAKPSGGCRCNEKDSNGNEVVATYNDPVQCRIRAKRDVGVQPAARPDNAHQPAQKYRSRSGSVDAPSQNVRDPVRERAQANYAAVLDELHNKFKGLKEGCFPRPKGCLCVIGKTAEGRDITERRMKDADCKCAEGQKGPGCPAA